ncbi:MAG TPA: polyprenyl synthetase family protein [Bacteroides sp.]|nr:polyprenyl synthetase family protein [Bacteroides sp.]
MSPLNEIRNPVVHEMREFEKHFRDAMKSDITLLNLITNYLLRIKGKQVRPLFVFLTAGLAGGITPSTYNAASLIELLHTASLIHDDVVDESFERRGFFSINALWKSKVSVLLGDYLLARGLLLSVENKEHELLGLVSDAVREMSEGELLQMQKSRKLNITIEEYFEIIRKKTATLFAACTACGAWSSSQDPDLTEKMRKFGENVGMAFQIKDDLFDYQKKGIIGKPTGNDIKEKKFTLPLIHALENSTESERRHIIRTIKKQNNNSKKVQEVIEFATSNNGIEFSTEKMFEYRDSALKILAELPENEYNNSLSRLVNYVVERKK